MHRLSFITLVALLTSVHADLARSLRPRQATDLDRCLSKAGVDYSISSSPDWAASSHAFNRRFTYQPAAVVRPTTNEQASQAVQCAAASNIAVTSRGGGHSYVADGVGGKDGSLVVDLTAFNAVSVDASTGIATIGAGGRLGTIYSKLMQQGGRAISAGTCPFVGIGGHAGHGGWGFSSRQHGLALDAVVQHDVVLADGSIISASATNNSDVFWALRGAASSFGVVTQYHLQTYAAPSSNTAYRYTYYTSPDLAARGIQAVQDWANSDSATGDFGMNFEVFPDAGQGQLKWQITGVYHGDSNDFDNRIRSLTDALGPTGDQDVQRNIGWIDSLIVNAGQSSLDVSGAADSTDAFYARSVVVQEMTSAAATNLAYFLSYDCSGYNGNNGNLWYFLQLHLVGGTGSAYSAVAEDATAYPRRNALWMGQAYIANHQGNAVSQDGINAMTTLVSKITDNQPAGQDFGGYLGYPFTNADDASHLFYGDNYPRLQQLKRQYDANNVFASPLNVVA